MTREPGRQLKLRIKLCSFAALGPGKVDLLEAIARCGSITAAARHQRMSYRRAWLLVDEMNRAFREPVIDAQFGGVRGGGARLTELGQAVVATYRELQRKAEDAVDAELSALAALLAEDVDDRAAAAEKVHGRAAWKADWRERD